MLPIFKVEVIIVISFLVSMQGSISHSHDLPGLLGELTDDSIPANVRMLKRAIILHPEPATRALLKTSFKWETPASLTVCFDAGPKYLRPKIAKVMNEWSLLSAGQVRFLFNVKGETEVQDEQGFIECKAGVRNNVRIGFKRLGSSSLIGTESMLDEFLNRNSVNLDLDGFPRKDDNTIRTVTLHEIGHTLGFLHEHQSPSAPCTNWAWSKIRMIHSWRGRDDKEKDKEMRQNIERVKEEILSNGQRAYRFTIYDPESIMHYDLGPAWFEDGDNNPCSKIRQPNKLSRTDREAMHQYYALSAPVDRTRSIDSLLSRPDLKDYHTVLRALRMAGAKR